MRFVVDMNLTPEWASLLAAQGHDAVHWRDIGRPAAPDDEIIAWAQINDRIVFTGDLDFAAKVATRHLTAPSVVQLRCDNTDPLVIGHFVAQSISNAGSDLDGGAILTIDPGSARLRPGPRDVP